MTSAAASFYTTGGTLSHDAPSYVERQADHDLFDGMRSGEFCYVLTSRQMGKSSLMVRTATKLREVGTGVIVLDLTAVGQNVTPEQWYDGLLAQIGRQLRLDDPLEALWRANERLGPCQRFFAAIRDIVLPSLKADLVIFVDEIDTVRSLPFRTDEFFAAIRECYNRRGQDPEFRRLTFCLLGVATPSDLIRDTRTTPFNIGRRIELHDFTEDESAPLAKGMRPSTSRGSSVTTSTSVSALSYAPREARRLLSRVLFWTGGHPYLTQRFCRSISEDIHVRGRAGVDRLGGELFFTHRAKERDDNLLFVRDRLLRSETDIPSLLELYLKVREGKPVADDETSQKISVLRLSGIVKSARGRLATRNRIYARVFDKAWVHAHMPEAEARRQREAFNRGVMRTALISAVVVTALAIVVVIAAQQTAKARKALAISSYSRSQVGRAPGMAGQQFEGLEALSDARQYYTNRAALRDEAIACLALLDLKEVSAGKSLLRNTNLLDLSADLKIAAVAARDGSIKITSVADEKPMATLPSLGHPVRSLRFGPAGILAAAYVSPGTHNVVIWDWRKQSQLFSTIASATPDAIDFSADGKRIAVGAEDGRHFIYSIPGGEVLKQWKPKLDTESARISQAVRFSPSGDWLALSSHDDFYVQIWSSSSSATQMVTTIYHPANVLSLAWHPHRDVLATACGDLNVRLWNPFTKELLKKLSGHEGRVTGVAFNHQGSLLASLGDDETIRLWVPATGRQITLAIPGQTFGEISFSADDRRLSAIGGKPISASVWQVLGGELLTVPVLAPTGDDLRSIDFSRDSRLFLAATGKQITFWDVESGHEIERMAVDNPSSVLFSAGNHDVITSSDSGIFKHELNVRPDAPSPCLATGLVERLRSRLDTLGTMAMDRDRKTMAVVQNETVLVGSIDPAATPVLRTNFLGAYYSQLALHPDNTWLATRSVDSTDLHLWNISGPTHSLEALVPVVIGCGKYFAFSPDGKWFAASSAGEHRFYRVGSWKTPQLRHRRQLASDQHAPVTFALDGRTIAVAWSRRTIQLLKLPDIDGRDLEVIATLESPDHLPLEALAFSPNGRRLAAATDRQIVQLWNLTALRDRLVDLNLQHNWTTLPETQQ
jgi:WD40 repeat protein